MRPRLIAVDDRGQCCLAGVCGVASMRPRLIAVDDWGVESAENKAKRASMRPRLIAVDDTKTWPSCVSSATSFNEATADRRG